MEIPFIGDLGFGIGGIGNVLYYLGIGLLIFIGTITVTFGVMFLFRRLMSKQIIEISMNTHRIKKMNGRFKKNPMGTRMLYVPKLKKYLPRIQEEDFFPMGKRDVLILLKDNNRMHHTARLPTYKELIKFYELVYGINSLSEYKELDEVLKTIYLLPNPSENLDWLAGQCDEANKAFGDVWWKHPNVMIIGCAFLGVMMVIILAIVAKKM